MEKIKAVAYCRVSTEEQAKEGISLDNQQDKVRAYATVKDLDLVDIVIDAGVSAKDLKREGLQRVLSMLQSKEAEALIVFKLDRMTRSTKDLLTLVYDVLIPQNIALHSISETLDTTNANGRFFLTMLGAMATWVRIPLNSATHSEAFRPPVPLIAAGSERSDAGVFLLNLTLHGFASLLFYFLVFRIDSPLSSIL